MVSEECNKVFCALEIVAPMVKSMNNSEQFVIVDIVISFCRGESLG